MRLVCPYCFEKYSARQVAFRCINPNASRCAPEEDRALGDYQRLLTPPKLQRVFSPANGWLRSSSEATCSCGMKTTKLVCPNCHNDLPSQFGTTDSFTIALIGAKEAGKSHFVAVLIHELS